MFYGYKSSLNSGKKEEFFCAPLLIYFSFGTRELELGEALAFSAHAFFLCQSELAPFLDPEQRECHTETGADSIKLAPQDSQDKVTHFLLGPLLGEQTLGPKRLS